MLCKINSLDHSDQILYWKFNKIHKSLIIIFVTVFLFFIFIILEFRGKKQQCKENFIPYLLCDPISFSSDSVSH